MLVFLIIPNIYAYRGKPINVIKKPDSCIPNKNWNSYFLIGEHYWFWDHIVVVCMKKIIINILLFLWCCTLYLCLGTSMHNYCTTLFFRFPAPWKCPVMQRLFQRIVFLALIFREKFWRVSFRGSFTDLWLMTMGSIRWRTEVQEEQTEFFPLLSAKHTQHLLRRYLEVVLSNFNFK